MVGLSLEHGTWLDARGIAPELACEHGLFSREDSLGFPYHTPEGEKAFAKWRHPNKRFSIEPSGRQLQLWLLHKWAAAESDTLVITEGEIDALSILAAGAWCVTSVPNGASSSRGDGDIDPTRDTGFSYLWKGAVLHPAIDRFKRIILATDADAPGQVLRDELAIRLGRDRCHWVVYPEGCKDANEVLVKHGRQAVLDLVARARPIVPDQLVRFSDIPRSSGVSLTTGWSGLDPHIRLLLPEVLVISGPPNHGKSQFSLALVANLARVHNMPGAILQFEDDVDRHRDDLIRYARAWRAGNGHPVPDEPEPWIDRMFVTIAPPEDIEDAQDKTLDWLKDRIHEAATRHGCKWVLIDPWNEIEHAWGLNESETAYTGKALRHLRALARRYQIAVIIVTHPSKGGGSKPLEDMTLYDVAGSAHWNNKPDHGIIIYRPKGSEETVVSIMKCRDFRKRGTPGAVRMRFDPASATFVYTGPHRGEAA
jgi:twinkle protein